ncbi:hypothetical protein D3C87_1164860 [compost metagenome]
MAQRIVLGRALQVHEDHVVGVFDVTIEVGFACEKVTLVEHVDPHRRTSAGPEWLTFRVTDLHLQGEGLALAHRGNATQDLGALQVIQGTDFIVRPPFAPVGRQAFEQGLDIGRTVGGGVIGVVVAHGVVLGIWRKPREQHRPCGSWLASDSGVSDEIYVDRYALIAGKPAPTVFCVFCQSGSGIT